MRRETRKGRKAQPAVDRVSQEQRTRNMQRIRCRDTFPEIIVRHLVCQLGFRSRYRLNDDKLPGRPDLVFPRLRKIIFVHGCFWHYHPGCKAAHIPQSRREYWYPKLKRNRQRDRANLRTLQRDGWKTLALWECELADQPSVATRIRAFLQR